MKPVVRRRGTAHMGLEGSQQHSSSADQTRHSCVHLPMCSPRVREVHIEFFRFFASYVPTCIALQQTGAPDKLTPTDYRYAVLLLGTALHNVRIDGDYTCWLMLTLLLYLEGALRCCDATLAAGSGAVAMLWDGLD